MNVEDGHMDVEDGDVYDVVDLNMNKIEDDIDFKEIVT
jgi:hypothetical protein